MPVLAIVILGGLAWLGYTKAAGFERRNGRPPGGAPPVLWAVICFLIGVFGIVALYIAMRSTQNKLNAGQGGWSPPPSGPPTYVPPLDASGLPPAPEEWVPPAPPQQWSPPAPPLPPPGPNAGGNDSLQGRQN